MNFATSAHDVLSATLTSVLASRIVAVEMGADLMVGLMRKPVGVLMPDGHAVDIRVGAVGSGVRLVTTDDAEEAFTQ